MRGPTVRFAAEAAYPALAAILVLLLSFRAGGFFAGTHGLVAVMLCAVLALWVSVARRPVAGLSAAGLVAAAALGAFSLWQLVSPSSSQAPARALLEANRTLVYALGVLTFALVPWRAARSRTVLAAVALAAGAVCLGALLSRLLPTVLPTAEGIVPERLSFPLTYWNALGIFAAVTSLLCLGLAAHRETARPVRAVAAAFVPVALTSLYLTFSRGAAGALLLGFAVLVAGGASRSLLLAILASIPGSALALATALSADALASVTPASAAAIDEGRHVAIAVAIAAGAGAILQLAAASVEHRWPRPSRRTTAIAAAGLCLALLVVAFAAGAPQRIGDEVRRFGEGGVVGHSDDQRNRFLDVRNNGRLAIWRSATDAWRSDRLAGRGAGTFETWWARHRPNGEQVVHAHSLYLQTLAESGLVGLAFLVLALAALLAGLGHALREPRRPLAAVALAALVAFLAHAGLDWDWEMPAVGLPVLVLAATVTARSPRGDERDRGAPSLARTVVALAALLLAVTPARIALSQWRLDRAVQAFRAGDCRGAIDAALASNRAIAARPEPFQLLAFCDVRLGAPRLAAAAARAAASRDPENWDFRYGLAVVRGATGQDPRRDARRALALNPRGRLPRDLVDALAGSSPRAWPRIARTATLPVGR